MTRKDDEATASQNSCPTATSPPIESLLEKTAAAKAFLKRLSLAAQTDPKPEIARQITSAIKKLPQMAQSGKNALENLAYPIVKTQDWQEAERIFSGFNDQERGSQRFEIRREEIAYMVNAKNTDILLAEVITDTPIFGLTAVHSLEQYSSPERGDFIQYFAVRLTPRKFNPTH